MGFLKHLVIFLPLLMTSAFAATPVRQLRRTTGNGWVVKARNSTNHGHVLKASRANSTHLSLNHTAAATFSEQAPSTAQKSWSITENIFEPLTELVKKITGLGKDKDKDKDKEQDQEKDKEKEKDKSSFFKKITGWGRNKDKDKDEDKNSNQEQDQEQDKDKDKDKGEDKNSNQEQDQEQDKDKEKEKGKGSWFKKITGWGRNNSKDKDKDSGNPPPPANKHSDARLVCSPGNSWGWKPAKGEDAQKGLDELKKTDGKPKSKPGPGTCDRLKCVDNSAIWWCNDKHEEFELDSFTHIANYAWDLVENCKEPYDSGSKDTGVLGQAFSPDGFWNVIVRRDDCSK
ncbi:hypothetical protein AAL_00417 [Moelleriella libera RCEF 2490]|uniref:Uncharacterized protein n=1 Tax=Moelleriella libera RCEF 2490 TaxID=1081109 RepID=A0A166UTU3_9HYPO|nr:hypothetical protein AAL_00417 [Moelleriella libera RCEF 2490]